MFLSLCLSLLLRKVESKYSMKNKWKINHPLYKDHLKSYVKKEMELESLINTVRIFSWNIEMEFGLQKCVILLLIMERWRIEEVADDMVMLDGGVEIKAMVGESDFNTLVLECDAVLTWRKVAVCEEDRSRLRSILKRKLNSCD